MGVKKYNKLVRDKIPEIIEASGKICKTEILSDNEYHIMQDFIYDEIPAGGVRDQFESAIRGRGAFRRFRNLAERLGIINEWYEYKEKAQKQLAIEWCEENGFSYE